MKKDKLEITYDEMANLIVLNGTIIIGKRLERGLMNKDDVGYYHGFLAELASSFRGSNNDAD